METTNMPEFGRLFNAAVDKFSRDNPCLGHEALAAVILPQAAESDRDHLEIGLYAAFKCGLFKDVSPEAFCDIPQEQLTRAVIGGRALFQTMERLTKSANPFQADFRIEEARAIVPWLKIAETRVPARNRLVAYARLGQLINRGGPLVVSNAGAKASYRSEEQLPAADVEPADLPRRRSSNLTDGELARRRAALEAAQAATRR